MKNEFLIMILVALVALAGCTGNPSQNGNGTPLIQPNASDNGSQNQLNQTFNQTVENGTNATIAPEGNVTENVTNGTLNPEENATLNATGGTGAVNISGSIELIAGLAKELKNDSDAASGINASSDLVSVFGTENLSGDDFDTYSERLNAGIDNVVADLDALNDQVSGIGQVDPDTKDVLAEDVAGLKDDLASYKDDVQSAESVDDLDATYADLMGYLVDSSDIVNEDLEDAVYALADNSAETASTLSDEAGTALSTLEAGCPGQKSAIDSIRGKLSQLGSVSDSLQTSMDDYDIPAMIGEMENMAELGNGITSDLGAVQSSC
ncbi:MAG: hypothetical protein PHS02_00940 [Candidatus ainarchaeum sp.]|nr:hypothetical protein [Candidatus ainarchaeum sp.]